MFLERVAEAEQVIASFVDDPLARVQQRAAVADQEVCDGRARGMAMERYISDSQVQAGLADLTAQVRQVGGRQEERGGFNQMLGRFRRFVSYCGNVALGMLASPLAPARQAAVTVQVDAFGPRIPADAYGGAAREAYLVSSNGGLPLRVVIRTPQGGSPIYVMLMAGMDRITWCEGANEPHHFYFSNVHGATMGRDFPGAIDDFSALMDAYIVPQGVYQEAVRRWHNGGDGDILSHSPNPNRPLVGVS
ncbi:MAG TPA: hypothetical protein VLE99_06695 [Candidatus Saccharimonadales bacterium]|nr:hypothetical protein [Candidatus Saccharimonadales bacterium]